MELFNSDLNFKDADLNQLELGDRRTFLKGGLAALVGGIVPLWTAKSAHAITNFAHAGQGLAHPSGSNLQELIAIANYRFERT